MTAPVWLCIASETIPISSGKMAPPDTPIIISPEISLFRDGRCINAWENMIEKIFEFPYPINATQIKIGIIDVAK
jgi:hypothetical protein